MKIAVVGAGAMGRWAVKELGISPEVDEIVVGDYDEDQAQAVAGEMGGGKATGRSSTRATPRASSAPSPAATRWSTRPSTSGTSP